MGLLKKFNVQLWSVKTDMADNVPATLEKIAKAGFTGVEFAGYFDYAAKDLRKILDDFGLEAVGSHISYSRNDDDPNCLAGYLEQAKKDAEYSNVLGARYIIEPAQRGFEDRDRTLRHAEKFNKVAKVVTDAGLTFGYHNHSHEFVKFGDEYAYDVFFAAMDKGLVKVEMDLFWVSAAGVDYMEYLKKYGDRVELVHVKQIAKDGSKNNVDAEEGKIDIKAVIEYGQSTGFVKDYILEREEYKRTPMEDVTVDCKYVLSL